VKRVLEPRILDKLESKNCVECMAMEAQDVLPRMLKGRAIEPLAS